MEEEVKECQFCGRDLKDKCQTWCQEEDAWLNAPLTSDEIDALKKRSNEPMYPLDEEVIPNGKL